MKLFVRRHQGVSLIVTVIFVSIFLLIMIGITQTTLFAIRDMRDFTRFDQAYHIAHGVTDVLHYMAQKEEERGMVGAEPSLNPNQLPPSISNILVNFPGMTIGPSGVHVRTAALPEDMVNIPGLTGTWYALPAPIVDATNGSVIGGTGSAAPTCGNPPQNLNDACHWNRIYAGESIRIPLFYEEEGQQQKATQFFLRIRSSFGELFSGGGDPVLLVWQITSADDLLTLARADGPSLFPLRRSIDPTSNNSELYATVINAAGDNMVLNGDSSQGIRSDSPGTRLTINEFLNRMASPYFHLQLSLFPKKLGGTEWSLDCQRIITDLQRREGCIQHIVPYLEYQILTNNSPIPDTKRIARATIKIGDLTQTFESQSRVAEAQAPFILEGF